MANYFSHESAFIDEGCTIGEGVKIWHFSHIMPNCIIGENCNIGQNVVISPEVVLGKNVKIQNNVSIYTGVVCEDDVLFGPQCVISGSNHSLKNGSYRYGSVEEKGKIRIGFGSWVSGICTIVAGGNVGKSCLLAPNSVLNKQMEDESIYAGRPAKLIKYHDDEIQNQ